MEHEMRMALAHQDGSFYVFPASTKVDDANRIAIQSAHMSNRPCRLIVVGIAELESSDSAGVKADV